MEFNSKYVHCVWDDELCGKQAIKRLQEVSNDTAPSY